LLKIYDLLGTFVWSKEILPGEAGAKLGENTVKWFGQDMTQGLVPMGGYVLLIKVNASDGEVATGYIRVGVTR